MRQLFVFLSLSITLLQYTFAQTATVRGIVKDSKTGELLESATVLQPPANGTTTDAKGNYELKVTAGEVTLVFSYLGMKADTSVFKIKEGEVKVLNREMGDAVLELQQVVIGESKIA